MKIARVCLVNKPENFLSCCQGERDDSAYELIIIKIVHRRRPTL